MTPELNFESMTYKAFSIKGGLCIFEQDNLSLEILDDLTNISDTLESLAWRSKTNFRILNSETSIVDTIKT